MKAIRLFWFSIAICAGSSIAAAQGEDPQIRKDLQKFYAKWDQACNTGDVKTLYSMIHPTFVMTHANGKTSNAAQVKKELAGMAKMSKDVKSNITLDQIQSQGDEAVAWCTMKVSFKMKQGSKWVPANFTSKFAETLKKFDGKWMFVASQELP